MHQNDPSSPPRNQELLRREQELKLEVAAARLRAAKAEYRLALLEFVLADPSLAGALSEVFHHDTGEELFSKLAQQEPSHAETH